MESRLNDEDAHARRVLRHCPVCRSIWRTTNPPDAHLVLKVVSHPTGHIHVKCPSCRALKVKDSRHWKLSTEEVAKLLSSTESSTRSATASAASVTSCPPIRVPTKSAKGARRKSKDLGLSIVYIGSSTLISLDRTEARV